MRRLRKLMSLLVVVFSLPTIAQQSMSLGDLKFVMPSSEVSSSARMLSMRMATTGISPKIYARVGGVAFIQTATPEFTVNSLSVDSVCMDDDYWKGAICFYIIGDLERSLYYYQKCDKSYAWYK